MMLGSRLRCTLDVATACRDRKGFACGSPESTFAPSRAVAPCAKKNAQKASVTKTIAAFKRLSRGVAIQSSA
jgi:hypothetical protein